jgi:peroxiredoxin Q/BCP
MRTRRYGSQLTGWLSVAATVGLAIAALAVIFYFNSSNSGDRAAGSLYPFEEGNPGPGETAPPIVLPSTDGDTFNLADLRGQTVLLYFQEGLMCQPCWEQLTAIEANRGQLDELGIDKIVSITTDPLDLLEQKVADEELSSPVLSDPDLAISRAYETNLYGMMGTSYNGHSFILIDEIGVIRWRADYGGAPKYTMYVPMDQLVADIREGLSTGRM